MVEFPPRLGRRDEAERPQVVTLAVDLDARLDGEHPRLEPMLVV